MSTPRSNPRSALLTLHRRREGWPLRQLRVPQAHHVTRGSLRVVVAVIDLGYRPHPDHRGHLWINPRPKRGDMHGWDFHDDDATLEYTGPNADTDYHSGHHAFVVGEVIACAPACPVMALRVGYRNPASWPRAIDYAVEHGAKVLLVPHGYLNGTCANGPPLFYRGADFAYPWDNPELRRAYEGAVDAGCLIVCGVSDNKGRRAAFPPAAIEGVLAVGSSDRRGQPADVAPWADYVEVAAPAGRRDGTALEQIACTGGQGSYIRLTGGCMAAGFGAGVAALVWSRFPDLSAGQLRQVLRNTARRPSADEGVWDDRLGYGVLDAARAVGLRDSQLRQDVRVAGAAVLRRSRLRVELINRGAFDVARAMVIAYNGNPRRPAAPRATLERPVTLRTRQLGHAIAAVCGLHRASVELKLAEPTAGPLWLERFSLDHHGSPDAHLRRVLVK